MTDCLNWTASRIARDVSSGETSASAVADAYLSHINQYDAAIDAFAWIDPETVRAEAGWVDRQRALGARLPLQGVPVGVKDIIDVAGMPTVAGFEPYRDRVAVRDAEIVARLRTLGAVILGKTHTTQFAVGDPAPTANPWDLSKSPAGSSAGSGAAVAAGMAPVTLGSQTAGSMLRPAAFNGVVGFKPGFGWMPLDGVIPLCWSLDHLGIYASSVEDVSLVYQSLVEEEEIAAPDRPRIGLLTEYLDMSDRDVSEHVRDVANALSDAGAWVSDIQLPVSFDDLHAAHQVIFSAEMAAVHSANLERYPDAYNPKIRAGVEAGRLVPAAWLLHAHRLQRVQTAAAERFLTRYDALLLPTVSTDACDRVETGDRRLQIPATLFGLPAISLPTGLSSSGLPLGSQLIGGRGTEMSLLALSRWVTDVVPLIGKPELA